MSIISFCTFMLMIQILKCFTTRVGGGGGGGGGGEKKRERAVKNGYSLQQVYNTIINTVLITARNERNKDLFPG